MFALGSHNSVTWGGGHCASRSWYWNANEKELSQTVITICAGGFSKCKQKENKGTQRN